MKEKPEEKNPYERVFDDAQRSLKKAGISLDRLDRVPDIKHDSATIPFPYGGEPSSAPWKK